MPFFAVLWTVDKLRLLIVEDDDDQRGLIRETLEDHFGANTVQGVASCRAALELDLKSFDLILTDYNLPDATGMELLRQVRQRCSTPVIMVTGRTSARSPPKPSAPAPAITSSSSAITCSPSRWWSRRT